MACEKKILVKRGLKSNLPADAALGEVLFATDTEELYIGQGAGNALSKIGMDMSNVVVVDGSGKIDPSVLPALAISEVFTAANETEQLALTVQTGDICIRTDENKSYIALGSTNDNMTNWQELLTPTDSVTSVNGKVGVVTLDTDDISEGSNNLYHTAARAKAAASALTLQELADVSTTGPSNGQILKYNSVNNEYEPSDLSIATSFTDLTDTPTGYAGKAGQQVIVNATEDGLDFVDCSTLDGGTF
jgi:hypothetical protein